MLVFYAGGAIREERLEKREFAARAEGDFAEVVVLSGDDFDENFYFNPDSLF